jgi:hypothetical protein
MDSDLALVIGIVIACLAIPSVLSVLSDRRAPRGSAITILIAGGLIVFAITGKPSGYQLGKLPDVFMNVVARYLP